MPTCIDIIVKLTPAFVALVIGAVASVIAFLQFRLAREKLRLDLFERRLVAYEKLQEYFTRVSQNGAVDDSTLGILWEARYKSRFLFSIGFDSYFEELTKIAVRLMTLGRQLNGPGALQLGEERSKVSEENTKLVLWHMDERNRVTDRYAPYLRFE